MIDFYRPPSARATRGQVARIEHLITNKIVQDASEPAEAFLFAALRFLVMYREGHANQGMYADCMTLYADYRRQL